MSLNIYIVVSKFIQVLWMWLSMKLYSSFHNSPNNKAVAPRPHIRGRSLFRLIVHTSCLGWKHMESWWKCLICYENVVELICKCTSLSMSSWTVFPFNKLNSFLFVLYTSLTAYLIVRASSCAWKCMDFMLVKHRTNHWTEVMITSAKVNAQSLPDV